MRENVMRGSGAAPKSRTFWRPRKVPQKAGPIIRDVIINRYWDMEAVFMCFYRKKEGGAAEEYAAPVPLVSQALAEAPSVASVSSMQRCNQVAGA